LKDTTDRHSDDISQSFHIGIGFKVIISPTKCDDDFYVAKLNEKLCEEILEVLKKSLILNFNKND
jgi:hypothetical protein